MKRVFNLTAGGLLLYMAFRFKKNESISKGVRRIGRKLTVRALERLDESKDPASVVHGVRTDIKKLRALVRLARASFSPKTYRAEVKAMRKIARLFAATRDAEVRLETLEKMSKQTRLRPEVVGRVKALLCAEYQNHCDNLKKHNCSPKATKQLRAAVRRIKRWNLDSHGWKTIGCGLKKSYECGLRTKTLAMRAGSAESFHALRKAVKELWYDVLLFHPARPSILSPLANELDSLGELLGAHHDLTVLANWVQQNIDATKRRALIANILRSRSRLEKSVWPFVSRIYSEDSQTFTRRLHFYWKSWRKGSC